MPAAMLTVPVPLTVVVPPAPTANAAAVVDIDRTGAAGGVSNREVARRTEHSRSSRPHDVERAVRGAARRRDRQIAQREDRRR